MTRKLISNLEPLQPEDIPSDFVNRENTKTALSNLIGPDSSRNIHLQGPQGTGKNLRRGVEQNRKVIFAVETGNKTKIENILSDPVNRNGNQFKDQDGGYTYYKENGKELENIQQLRDADYHILEVEPENPVPECAELENHPEEDIEYFCLYRDDTGHCTTLGEPCILTQAND